MRPAGALLVAILAALIVAASSAIGSGRPDGGIGADAGAAARAAPDQLPLSHASAADPATSRPLDAGDQDRATPGAPARAAARSHSTPRPFEHVRHEQFDCTACHGTGEQHRTVLVRTPRDCASCHHDARRGLECITCHRVETLPEQLSVEAVMLLSVRDGAAPRVLPFGHERHARVACRDCHQAPVTLQRNRECRSCHARHEQPNANCTVCHTRELKPQHQAEAHLSCAGAGCHAADVQIQPSSRNTCIACHPQQDTHEPGNDCASCHQVPDSAALKVTSRGGRR